MSRLHYKNNDVNIVIRQRKKILSCFETSDETLTVSFKNKIMLESKIKQNKGPISIVGTVRLYGNKVLPSCRVYTPKCRHHQYNKENVGYHYV